MRHLRLVHSAPASRPTRVGQDAAGGECAECAQRPEVEREDEAIDPEVRTLLEHVRRLTPLPNVVRARALVRARAALAAASPASTTEATEERPAPSRHPSWATLLVAMALASAVGTAAGAFLARRSNAADAGARTKLNVTAMRFDAPVGYELAW